jgi:hypothetical protein
MRKTNNGAPPSLRQQGRGMRTSYGAWALDAAAEEVMDDLSDLLRPRVEADPEGQIARPSRMG